MAEYQIKGDTKRSRLEEKIPLQTPFRVMLEVSNVCNFQCFFCVHGQANNNGGVMSFKLAQKCINDLLRFSNKIKVLSFFNNGEPLINKKLPEMIQYAKNMQVANNIDFTTNASLMNHEMADKLINAGVQRINISIYGLDEEQYFRTTKTRIYFEKFLENLKYLYEIRGICRIAIKIIDTAFTDETDKVRFFDIFSNFCDTISVEHIVPMYYELNDTTEETLNLYGHKAVVKNLCPVSFYTMSISIDGKVSPCCIDTQYALAFGDANEQSLFDIWNGASFRKFQIEQLTNGRHSIMPCGNCRYPDLVAMDNIDAFRDQILGKLG